jgi:type IV secretion system protein TrbE
MRPHSAAPNGVFAENLLLYGSLERGAVAAKGFWLEPPDLRGASNERRNAFQDKVRALLALVGPGRRLQVQWSCDADYRAELLRYHEETQRSAHPAVRRVRNERFARYWRRMHDRELRRERLAVFLSIEITSYSGNVATRSSLLARYRGLLGQLQAQFEEFASAMRTILGPDTPLRPMDDAAHCECLRRFLNPAMARRDGVIAPCDPGLTIQENCWLSDGVGQPDGGFCLDGHNHAVLVLTRWPQATRPGIVTHLTGLPILDYQISVNVTPVETRGEIRREERAMERLSGEYADERRHSLWVAMQKKERKIESLAGGFARPFQVAYVIRVWDATREGLREKVSQLQAAIHAMNGAQYYECARPVTAMKHFFGTWPGWTHSSYRDWDRYAEDAYLADLLPFSSTFTGCLESAEALYDGVNRNLVGFSTQAGGSPQHAVLFGMTGAGKSELMRDLLLQTAGLFDYTLIVEEGLSYQPLTEALGETPIVVQPDAPLTLNYLDTLCLPLTQLQVASAVALLARMIGEPADAERQALREAQLAQYVHLLYQDAHADWARRNPAPAREAARLACAVHGWREQMPAGATALEAYADLRDRRKAGDGEAEDFVARLDEAALTRFAQDPRTARWVTHTACALWRPEDFPTHGALVELLAFGRLPEHPKEETDRLATLLGAWSAHGQYGRLFDGVTNMSLRKSVAHFELGLIPEQATALKTAAGLLISGFARQHILALPRAQRKRVVFEEVARFLDVPGGEAIVAESYAQLRKFNCWTVSIVQQYARFRASRVRAAVIGNAKQFLLMRQADRSDLQDLARDIPLPESLMDVIPGYPLPEQQAPGQRHSSACYFLPTATPPQCGTLRHVQPRTEEAHAPVAAA